MEIKDKVRMQVRNGESRDVPTFGRDGHDERLSKKEYNGNEN